jgi:eukaryotic-like serine/threonine-protein kinase
VTVGGDWTSSTALVPGEGIRLVRDSGSISAAFAPAGAAAELVAARLPAPGCPTAQRQVIGVDDLRGAAVAWSGCPGSAAVTEAALSDPGHPGWVVWVEVRSVDGTPGVEEVLRGLVVRP